MAMQCMWDNGYHFCLCLFVLWTMEQFVQHAKVGAHETAIAISVCVCLSHEPFFQHVKAGACETAITTFVRVCLCHELWNHLFSTLNRDNHCHFCSWSFGYIPWNHRPLVIAGGMSNNCFHCCSCSFRAWTMEPFLITKSYGGTRCLSAIQ